MRRSWSLAVVLLLALASAPASVRAQAVEAATAATLDEATRTVTALGSVVGVTGTDESRAWFGLRYAQPPVGEFRWRAPRPARAWADTFEATRHGPRCPQPEPRLDGELRSTGDEDCLFLNVWAPRSEARARRPVMVWIHSGANVARSGSDIDGGKLAATQNVVVVTINYRLGAFGWFHHRALARRASTPEDASGNYGTLDQIAALEWVRDNIEAFGGDPARVTVFGESAGSWDTFGLLVAPRARGLFHGAILQSGNMPFYTLAEAANYRDDAEPGFPKSSAELTLQLLEHAGRASDRLTARRLADSMSDEQLRQFLGSRSHADFLLAERAIQVAHAESTLVVGQRRYLPGLFMDGAVLPQEPFLEAARAGRVHRVPILIGSNRDEDIQGLLLYDRSLVRPVAPGRYRYTEPLYALILVEHLGKLWQADGVDAPAAILARTQPVYAYRFAWDEQHRIPNVHIENGSVAAMHGMHVPFVFGRPSLPLAADAQASFEEVSAATMAWWGEFAYHGNPARGRGGRLARWPRWTASRGETMLLDSPEEGGLSVVRLRASVQSVLDGIRNDPRLPSLSMRCRLYRDIVDHAFGANHRGGRLTLDDYRAVESGECHRRYPLQAALVRQPGLSAGRAFRDCASCPAMTVVAAGTFRMGVDAGAAAGEGDDHPRHEVRIERPFALGTYEVTRREFAAFVAATGHDGGRSCHDLVEGEWQLVADRTWRNPGYEQTDEHPVACVSWDDAKAYVAWLAARTGAPYRLPSEAEWEYVARAGGPGELPRENYGHDDANYGAEQCCAPLTAGRDQWLQTSPVGRFEPDAVGLHDVRGNLWEWLEDCYHDSYAGAPVDGRARTADCSHPDRRTLRGGSWRDARALLRAGYRLRGPKGERYVTLGFRVARDLP